ncbi:MAG TPA: SDR family oxidoreductase [Allosphingosinicella sp.]|nr:SDR family oxidoreductase [Allosphingosinicella sp.]
MSVPDFLGLEGKVAIVTGAAGGIGGETVKLLVEQGVKVVAEDLRPSVRELESAGSVVTVEGDVSDEAVAARAVAAARDAFGRLDILVNNAGRTFMKSVLEMTVAEWDGIMQTNARGCFVQSRAALGAMVEGGGGAIVNVASIVSLVGMPGIAAYAASKGAIAQLTKVLAIDFGGQNIRVNAVAPGVVETGILDDVVPDGRQALIGAGPAHVLGRVAQPDEIANVIAFLASPRSSFITGAIVLADGGYTSL